MDIKTGLCLINNFLENINWESPQKRDFLLWAMEFTLTKGYIYFEGMVFQQTNGAAMGSPMIPPYANIFMHMLEKETVNKHSTHVCSAVPTGLDWPPRRIVNYLWPFSNAQLLIIITITCKSSAQMWQPVCWCK